MDFEKVKGVVRHIVTGIGAALIGFGIATEDAVSAVLTSWEGIVGGIATIVGIVASIRDKMAK